MPWACEAVSAILRAISSPAVLSPPAHLPTPARSRLRSGRHRARQDQDLSNGYYTSASGPAKPPYSAARRAQQAPLAMRGVVLAAALAAVFAGVRAETAIELNGSNGYIAMDDLVRR